MPIAGQTPLTNITIAKEQSVTFQPLLLAEITFSDGSILRLAPENIDATLGGPMYHGHDWKPRIAQQTVAAVQSETDNGILQSPQASFTLVDSDKYLWTEWEVTKGFKGAKIVLKFVFWDPDTNTFSDDEMIRFVGICDPSLPDYTSLQVNAKNILNLANFNLPTVRIGRRCPWIFPTKYEDRVQAATNPDSDFFECGYSPDVVSADARGNLDGGAPFTDCDYTWESCLDRMGNRLLPTTSNDVLNPVQIEQDDSGRHTGRFGGIHYDPPSSWRGRAYLTGTKDEGINNTNEAKFNDYFPMLYGTSFVEPPVMNVIGEPNTTRFEVVVCVGQAGNDDFGADSVHIVIVNDIIVPHLVEGGPPLYWQWVNIGKRDGYCNRSVIYNGQGDPYGSLACINIVVPRSVQDSSSIPRVRVLLDGPKVRKWNSVDPTDYVKDFSSNCSWILADVLTWCGRNANDFDLQTFIDAARMCDVPVTYTDLTGTTQNHPRYQFGFALRDRRSSAEIVKNLLNAMKGMLSAYTGIDAALTGKLQLQIKQTLADQQPSPVSMSNDADPRVSADGATETTTDGFVVYRFDESNILRKGPDRNSPSTFKITQKPISDSPNRVAVQFQDEDYFYSPDSISMVDSEDIGRVKQEVSGSVVAEGLVNLDQGKRTLQSFLAETFRGNPRTGINDKNDSGGTWIVEFETSFRAIHVKVGDIVEVSQTDYALDAQLFRVLAVAPTANCERLLIRAQWHEDDWYTDRYGQRPDPLLQAQRRHRLLRPPFGWLPDMEAPQSWDPIWDPTEKSFGLAELYEAAADGTVLCKLRVRGKMPVNSFTSKTSPPFAPRATISGGGSIAAGTYWLCLVGVDEDDLLTAPGNPLARAVATTGSRTLSLVNIYWQEGTVGWRLYAGTNPNKLSLQSTGSGTPDHIDLTTYKVANQALPDVEFDHMHIKVKKVRHSGPWGLSVASASGNVLTLNSPTFTSNEWINRDISIIGRQANTDDLPIWDFHVTASGATTLTLAGVSDLVALGVKPGDVVVMRTKPDIITENTIGDSKFINEVDYHYPPIAIIGAESAPILLTLATAHDFATGDEVLVQNVLGNDAANGTWGSITVPTTGDEVFNKTHLYLDSSASDGTYISGGTVRRITHGLSAAAENGDLVMIIGGTGRGQIHRIVDNDQTTLTIDGKWEVTPDSTSKFIVVEDAWLTEVKSTPSFNSDPNKIGEFQINVDNFLSQVLWVQAFTESSDDRQSMTQDSPGREIYVYGGPGDSQAVYDKATFNLSVSGDLATGTDVAPHYIIRQPGTPSSCEVRIKTAPVGADVKIDIMYTPPGAGVGGGSTVSVFASPADMIIIPPGTSTLLLFNNLDPSITFEENGVLTANVTQVGTTTKGSCVTAVFKWRIGT